MRNKILWTFGTMAITAVINLLILIFTSQLLGTEGRGVISLLVLGITIIALVSNIVGGPALIYLVPRIDLFTIFFLSYIWACISSVLLTLFLHYFHLIPDNLTTHIFFLSVLQNLLSVNLFILIGKEKIHESNVVSFVQILLLFISLLILLIVLHKKTVLSYIISSYIAYAFSFVISFLALAKGLKINRLTEIGIVLQEIFKCGFLVQLSNTMQLLNYRLSFYILAFYYSTSLVGIYSTGIAVCESVWIISNSIIKVQYARISNSSDITYCRVLTIKLSKISLLLTVIATIFIFLLPQDFFIFIFGKNFGAIHTVIFSVCIGIASIGMTILYNHYFAGIGKLYINTIGSSIGFAFTLVFGLILIPKYGLVGAGVTSSISYLATSTFITIVFMKETKIKFIELLPTMEDYYFSVKEIRAFINSKQKFLKS